MTETVLVIEFLNIVIYPDGLASLRLKFGACHLLFFKNHLTG
jgi:hypothetical protein